MPTSRPRILLTGSSGQVGGDLLPLLQRFGEVVAPDRSELNLSDPQAISDFVRQISPRWIINPAAYTAVDKAESEPESAHAINAEAPRVLGEEAKRLGAAMIHFSTDYVFDGSGTTPWKESDPTGPLSTYGKTKLASEQALAALGHPHLVIRTSWVYSTHGKNFLRTILGLARERDELRIVADQHGAPTWSRDLATLVAHAIEQVEHTASSHNITLAEALQPLSGIYHAAASGTTTWFDFAQYFITAAAKDESDQHFAKLTPISTAEYPTLAERPANSRLDGSKLTRAFDFKMPLWQESVQQALAELLQKSHS